MRTLTVYLLIVVTAASVMFCAMNSVESPEHKILGSWKELAWEYEKVYNRAARNDIGPDTISQSVKDQLGQHLVIHSAELWQFKPDGTLLLRGMGNDKEVKWKLKGRGHILELEYDNRVIEHYNLTQLTANTMVLNFDSDIQVKGIAKLTFIK